MPAVGLGDDLVGLDHDDAVELQALGVDRLEHGDARRVSRSPSQSSTSARRPTGATTPIVPSSSSASAAIASRTASAQVSAASTSCTRGSTPVSRTASGRSAPGIAARASVGGEVEDLRGVAVVGRQPERVLVLAGQRLGPGRRGLVGRAATTTGRRHRRSSSSRADRDGRPSATASATGPAPRRRGRARSRRPRSTASAARRRATVPAAPSRRSSTVDSSGTVSSYRSASGSSLGLGLRRLAEQVAQLVEQRHVLDAEVVGAQRLEEVVDLLPARARRAASRASRSRSASQPSTSTASTTGHQARAKSVNVAVAEHRVRELVRDRAREPRSPVDLPPQRVDQLVGDLAARPGCASGRSRAGAGAERRSSRRRRVSTSSR